MSCSVPNGVSSFGIWNEPNNPDFLQIARPKEPGSGPADRYRQLYSAAWNTIKKDDDDDPAKPAAYPEAKVMLGELAQFRRGGRLSSATRCPTPTKMVRGREVQRKRVGLDALDFLERVVRPPTAEAPLIRTSGVAWHPYQHRDPPTDDGREGAVGIGRIYDIRRRVLCLHRELSDGQRLLATNSSKVPNLMFTEFGYFNTPKLPPDRTSIKQNENSRGKNRDWQTERTKATFINEALARAVKKNTDRARRNPVGMFVFFGATETTPLRKELTVCQPDLPEPFPKGEWCDLFSVPYRQEYGLFSRRGEVTGLRPYGKDNDETDGRNFKSLAFPQERRAYCTIYRWAEGRGYGNPPSPCP